MPAWTKVAIDRLAEAAGISAGRVFRPVNKGGSPHGRRAPAPKRNDKRDPLAEQYVRQLNWWTGLEETETLREAVSQMMNAGEVSPQFIWSLVEKSKNLWPPARRMVLLDVYGGQPHGVPIDNLFEFRATKAEILLALGNFEDAASTAEEALRSPLPDPTWTAEAVIRNIAGLAENELSHLPEARNHFERALKVLEAHVNPMDHPYVAATLSNLASVHKAEGRYGEARSLYERALAIVEQVLGPIIPRSVPR